MRTSVVDFLNHGLLPFVGREKEVERILAFARGSDDSSGLRTLLLNGEAGSGKSRLVDETIARMEAEGDLVIHTKLRPESAVAPAPLLSVALWSSPSASPLLRQEPDPNLPAVIGAVRRLCRLRKTVLVIEDAHLLEGAGVREFSLFIEALAEEPLVLLIAARPAEMTARGAFEAYLIEELTLPPLDGNDIRKLWLDLFGIGAEEDALQILGEATLGNPLAFRSALRGAINAGILIQEGENWKVTVDRNAFREMAERSARRLSEGMASHLNDEERIAAIRLARLGETFAPEAAHLLVEDADRMISLLLFKGILVRTNTASASLRDPAVRGLPIAFAHSLLHRTLLENDVKMIIPLLTLIASNLPLYSVTPFLLLEKESDLEEVPIDLLSEVVHNTIDITNRMDRSADWILAPRIWEIIEKMSIAVMDLKGTEEEKRWIRLHTLGTRLTLLGRADESSEYLELSSRLLEETAEGLETGDKEMLALHIRSHLHLFRYASRRDRPRCSGLIRGVEELVARYPEMRMSEEYRFFLRTIGSCAYIFGFYLNDLRYLKDACQRAAEQSGENPDIYREWIHDFGYYLLSSFTTLEELQEKEQLLAELRQKRSVRAHYYIREISFLIDTGWNAEAVELIAKYRPRLRDIGLLRTVASCFIYESEGLLALDNPLEVVLARVNEALIDPTVEKAVQDRRREHVGRNLMSWLVMLGREEELEQLKEHIGVGENVAPLTIRILLGLPSLESLRDVELVRPVAGPESIDIDDADADLDLLIPIARGLLDDRPPAGEDLENLRSFLGEPILRRYRILSIQTAIRLIRELEKRGMIELDEEWKGSLRNSVESALDWLAKRNILRAARHLYETESSFLSPESVSAWEERLGKEVKGEEAEEEQTTRITMFGAITYQHPGEGVERLRGGRNHLMLGLLVADAILKVPLTRNAFVTIASGVEDDPERARRTMNMAVLRLREAIGQEIVLTDDETPRLNRERVAVDLIEARELLAEADSLIRKRRLTQAINLVRRVFELSAGDVPFPGLYEELFENLRREFEEDLLNVTLTLGRRLLTERDYKNGLDILTQGVDLIPDNEELEELYSQALNSARGFGLKNSASPLVVS